jgi:hypothetical protein
MQGFENMRDSVKSLAGPLQMRVDELEVLALKFVARCYTLLATFGRCS